MRHSLRHPRGFTLVELLVVIGIITILIALLLSALARARRHADEVRCAANLRTIGQALVMYTQQHGYYPGCQGISNSYNFAVWPTRLRPYVGDEQRVFYCPAQDERCEWRKGSTAPGPVAGEPEARFGYELGERLLLDSPGFSLKYYFSYGYNGWGTYPNIRDLYKGLGPTVSIHASSPYRELKASRVRVPAQMIAVADVTADGWADYWISPIPTAAGEPPGSIHRDGANVLFCDGHVQWYAQKELRKPLAFGTAEERLRWQRMERMWNYDHTFSMN